MPKKLLELVAIFIIVTGLLYSLNLFGKKKNIIKKESGSGAVLTIKPISVSAVPGNSFSVDVYIDTKEDIISAAELHLTYDPAILSGVSITPGDFLPTQIVTGRNVNGNADIILGAKIEYNRTGNTNPVPKKGTGTLVILKFIALKPSITQLNFKGSTKIAAIGVTGNSIASMTGSHINVLAPTKALAPKFSP